MPLWSTGGGGADLQVVAGLALAGRCLDRHGRAAFAIDHPHRVFLHRGGQPWERAVSTDLRLLADLAHRNGKQGRTGDARERISEGDRAFDLGCTGLASLRHDLDVEWAAGEQFVDF